MNGKLINLTLQDIDLYRMDGTAIHIPRSGQVAWADKQATAVATMDGIPVDRLTYRGPIEGLPDPVQGTIYLVSLDVFQALEGSRPDVLTPDYEHAAVRDQTGRIIGSHRLVTA